MAHPTHRRPRPCSHAVRSFSSGPAKRISRSGADPVRPRSAQSQLLALRVYAAAAAVLAIGLALFASPGPGDLLLHFAWVAALSILVTGSLIVIVGVWTTTGVYAAILLCL